MDTTLLRRGWLVFVLGWVAALGCANGVDSEYTSNNRRLRSPTLDAGESVSDDAATTPEAPFPEGATTPPNTPAAPSWEAEEGAHQGVEVISDPAASMGARVGGFDEVGDALTFSNVPEATIAIRYSLASQFPKQLSLYVNGDDIATVMFTHTDSWSAHDTIAVRVPVGGTLSLRLNPEDVAANRGEAGPQLDKLVVPYDGASGTEYPVASAGEIEAAMQSAQPGDTLVMAEGVWVDQVIRLEGHGAPERPITLRASSPGEVLLTGASKLEVSGSYLVVDGLRFENGALSQDEDKVIQFADHDTHHCRITNTSVVGYNPSDKDLRYFWMSLKGRYNRIDHCDFGDQTHAGEIIVIWLDGEPNYHLIDHNYIHDRAEGTGETLRIGSSGNSLTDSNTTVAYNHFERCNGEHEMICNKSCGNVYRNNLLRDNEGHVSLRHGNRCRVEGNLFLGYGASGMGGVRIIGEDHVVVNNYFAGMGDFAIMMRNGIPNTPLNGYAQVKNAVVAFNTMYDCRDTLFIGYHKNDDDTLAPKDCVIANNVVSSDRGPLVTFDDAPLDLSFAGNIMHGASLGIETPSGVSKVDPQLDCDSDGLCTLRPGSPAIDGADGSYEGPVGDVRGMQRDASPDVGACESAGGTAGPWPGTERVGPA